MRTVINECKHCGIEYSYYLSGSYIPDYNSNDYCTGCEEVRAKAIAEAFKKVPVLFKYEFIKTKDFNLDELIKIEKDREDKEKREYEDAVERGEVRFSLAKRVWPSLYNWDRKEYRKYSQIEHNGELYSYAYWPSNPEEAEIMVKKKIDVKTGNIVTK